MARILIADDNGTNRCVLVDVLEDDGHELVEATDGCEALRLIEASLPDLIMLDVMMPNMDGIECCRQLQKGERTRDIPVILVTSLGDDEHVVRGLDAGATDYVVKPFQRLVVQARVRAALRVKTAMDELENRNRQVDQLASELETKNHTLRELTMHDGLTGLANRLLLISRLEHALDRWRRDPGQEFAVLFLDFDGFKSVNDTLGHDVGDELLKSIAVRLRASLRDVDTVGSVPSRLGGDEFVVLLEGVEGTEQAKVAAERIRRALAQPHLLGDRQVVCTASIGIVTSGQDYGSAHEIIRDADRAMYRAKELGKGRHVLFDQRMQEDLSVDLERRRALSAAIDGGELLLHYQPIVDLHSPRITGCEAVVRWNDPVRGLLAADQFMPFADQVRMIVPIGRLVFEQLAEQLQRWRGSGMVVPNITVNIWASQLREVDLADAVAALIECGGIDPQQLTLEIPESVFLDMREEDTSYLSHLRKSGVRLAMDGCGKGHSAMTRLHRFPIDVLKIDRSVTASLGVQRAYAAIVQAVVGLAHNLDMTVVAVGVESGDQVALLQALDCDCGQGRFLAEPMEAEKLESHLAQHSGRSRSA
jgi:diguanylate cyclase (GGDEF)-like protein